MIAIAVIVVSLLANGPKALQNAKCLIHSHHFCKEVVAPTPVIVVVPGDGEPDVAPPLPAEKREGI